MKVVNRRIILTLVFFLALVELSRSEVGVGIWPAKFSLNVSPFKTSYIYVFLFNPSEKDIEVSINFRCKNCIEDFKILNYTLGKIELLPSIEIIPSKALIPKGTIPPNSQQILLKISNYPLLKKRLSLGFLNLKIPYYSLLLGERRIDGRIEASTLTTRTLMIITSEANLKLVGISPLLITLALGIILAIILIVYVRYKKIGLPSPRPSFRSS